MAIKGDARDTNKTAAQNDIHGDKPLMAAIVAGCCGCN
jgi:hypothetical protein